MENSSNNVYYQGYSLLPAEQRALSSLLNVVEIEESWLERLPEGPDFVFADQVALEVKARDNWSLTKSQVESIGNYGYFVIIVSKPTSVKVDSVYQSISEVEDQGVIDEIIARMKKK